MLVDDLPSWVYFPDKERAEWVNNIIKQVNPFRTIRDRWVSLELKKNSFFIDINPRRLYRVFYIG